MITWAKTRNIDWPASCMELFDLYLAPETQNVTVRCRLSQTNVSSTDA